MRRSEGTNRTDKADLGLVRSLLYYPDDAVNCVIEQWVPSARVAYVSGGQGVITLTPGCASALGRVE